MKPEIDAAAAFESCNRARRNCEQECDKLRAALQLLWDEVNDEERCAQERAPGVYSHQVSEPCRSAVLCALKGKP